MNCQRPLILCVLVLSVVMDNTRALSLDGTVIYYVCLFLCACFSFLLSSLYSPALLEVVSGEVSPEYFAFIPTYLCWR